ncbi:MAG: hydantoinase/oxoprolinase family protein [Actinobacteria bacterium]|nr:MAG: hydantoinase/oxoprolinase family protein [Actinomycetota bacterium]
MSVRVGIDVGGTFTDAVAVDAAARLVTAKIPSTPEDPGEGFLGALQELGHRAEFARDEIAYLVHGSTIATNAIVQRRTARAGLVTTAGFRDLLEIGTQQRATLYDLNEPKSEPLVTRELRVEVAERTGAQGEVVLPLDEDDVRRAADVLRERGAEAVAVSFLFAFLNPAHERRAAEILAAELPGVPVTLSSDVAPEFREYLRTATTVVNASLLPLVGRYVERLRARLDEAGIRAPLHLMQSNGGVARAETAARLPVALISSGPAGGAIAAARLGALAGDADVLGFDMGGTTADVCLVVGGKPQMRFRGEAAGHPVNLPQVDLLSVGAGGGSIARVDRFGALLVGPESAGAEPGPAAYRRGGEDATVTDAHVVLGALDPAHFLGGRMELDPAAARDALERHVARPLGLSAEEAAAAVVRIADATMVRALRVISIARGHDPRRFALVAFGGAGPMHACSIAEELGIVRVLVPRYPGVASALGLLLSDVHHDLRQTWLRPTHAVDPDELGERLRELEGRARELLEASGFPDATGRIDFEVDMRYRGQAYELTVPLRVGSAGGEPLRQAEQAFHEAHRAAYGHDSPVEDVELVTLRARAVGPVEAPRWGTSNGRGPAAPTGRRSIHSPSGRSEFTVYERAVLAEGAHLDGPAVLEQDDSTVLVPSGWSLEVGAAETAVLTSEAA